MTATIHLKHFQASEILLDNAQAWGVLRFFWPDSNVKPGTLSKQDREFAQALLVEAIDASYEMGYVEILFRSFIGPSVAPSFKGIRKAVTTFCRKALKHWFKHATAEELADPEIYESVRVTLARNFRTVWSMRENGLPLTW